MAVETFIPRSTNISVTTYDAGTQTLTVTFQDGRQYEYSSVPESVWHGLKHAASVGSYFYRQVRDVFNYTEV